MQVLENLDDCFREDENEMKKISSAIIIKKADPLMIMNQFFDKNFNKNFDEMDEKFRDNIAIKKTKIFGSFHDISLIYYNKEI